MNVHVYTKKHLCFIHCTLSNCAMGYKDNRVNILYLLRIFIFIFIYVEFRRMKTNFRGSSSYYVFDFLIYIFSCLCVHNLLFCNKMLIQYCWCFFFVLCRFLLYLFRCFFFRYIFSFIRFLSTLYNKLPVLFVTQNAFCHETWTAPKKAPKNLSFYLHLKRIQNFYSEKKNNQTIYQNHKKNKSNEK